MKSITFWMHQNESQFWHLVFKDGWLTRKGSWLLFFASWILMLLPLWLASQGMLNFLVAFFLFCLGLVMGLAYGYEGKAKQFGFSAPFTKDPLGWRAAKKSYDQPSDQQEPGKIDKDPPKP